MLGTSHGCRGMSITETRELQTAAPILVMLGLVPSIHVFVTAACRNIDRKARSAQLEAGKLVDGGPPAFAGAGSASTMTA